MIDLALFLIVSVMGLVVSFLVFAVKDILHAALMLSAVFFVNSLFFFMLDQPLLAVVQLFIMIGGITTFLFVGVASVQYSKFKHTEVAGLAVLWTIVFVILVLPLNYVQITPFQSNLFGPDSIALSLGTSSMLFYLMLFTMFGVALGAILLLKKVGADK
jgi:NADH-quinone oxidoreductase subunit J